ncbi:Stromal processing peptidase, chloroplastic [Seminavis robusta]|uniref:Stromal processing peptidase, chloroplastic n=1 Tax=Seminavis robusta TaxID=568900 RepID=A0A9N8EEK8_9STRA|nr:Stromal processing peptidase, chloroplastic [Seminavis robusta]|eukprot:Sro879_g214930.1 Stromal processing peptidase, chloroplastic (1066) ;mRNA; r:38782-42236
MVFLPKHAVMMLLLFLLEANLELCQAIPRPQRLRKGESSSKAPPSKTAMKDIKKHATKKESQLKTDQDEADFFHQYIVRLLDGDTQSMPPPPSKDDEDSDEDPVDSTGPPAEDGTSAPTSSPVASASTTTERTAWPHTLSDIPLDTRVMVGELPNKLRYMALENSEPPGRLELRLHVDAGSLEEREGEEGMAHFLEHLAFQSLKSFPGLNVLEELLKLGIDAQSYHSNAYTTHNEVVYRLTVPQLDNKTIDTCFKVMRDYADGMLLLEDEINTERGVVLSEKQDLASVEERIWDRYFPWSLPDNLLTIRFPIGLEESINAFTRQQFVEFYKRLYTSQYITFIVVGDMNTTAMEDLIVQYFGSMDYAGERNPLPDYGTIPVGVGLRTAVFAEDELQGDYLYLESFKSGTEDGAEELDTMERREKRMKTNVCNTILQTRLQAMSSNASSPIAWGGAYVDRWYDVVEFLDVWVQPKEELWEEAVAVIEQELRRATTYGFLPSEVDTVKSDILNSYEQSVLSKDTRESYDMADGLRDSINGNNVVSTPEENLRIAALVLDKITPDALLEHYNSYWWNTGDINLYYTSSTISMDEAEAAQRLEDLYLESQLAEVDPPVEPKNVSFAYTDFGPPGTVVSDTLVDDLDIRQLKLSNNVRVNMKTTEFDDGVIEIVARFGTGTLGQPRDATHLDEFSAYMINWGGLGEHSWEELDRVLAGRTWGASFQVQQGAFVLRGVTNPDDLELQLQVLAAHLVDPGYRDEAVGWWESDSGASLNYLQNTLYGTYNHEMYGWLLGGDQRFTEPTEEDFFAYDASHAREWLEPQLENSYLEISLVGDLDQTEAISLLLETIGALPVRSDTPPQFTAEDRAINRPSAPQEKVIPYESTIPNAAVMLTWSIPALLGANVTEFRHLQVLAAILDARAYDKIREELGSAYAPQAFADFSSDFDYGYMFLYSEGLPEEMNPLADVMVAMTEDITSSGGSITEEEVVQAVLPIQSRYQESLRSNSYWLNAVLQESQAEPFELDWARTYIDDYNSVTADALNAMAVQYLALDKAIQITLLPVDDVSVF